MSLTREQVEAVEYQLLHTCPHCAADENAMEALTQIRTLTEYAKASPSMVGTIHRIAARTLAVHEILKEEEG